MQKSTAMTLHRGFVNRVSSFISYERVSDGIVVKAALSERFNARKADGLQDLFDDYAGRSNARGSGAGTFLIKYAIIADDIVRVTTGLGDKLEANAHEKDYFMLPSPAAFELAEDERKITLSTSRMKLVVYKKTPADCMGRDDRDILSYEIFNRDGDSVLKEAVDEKSIYFGYFAPPLGRQKDRGGDLWTVQSFHRYHDEDFYGFGEQFVDFSKRGLVVDTWNGDAGNCQGSISYKNIPFFVSTRGYGFLQASDRHARFDMGSRTQYGWTFKTRGDRLDYFVFVDGDPKGILGKYFSLTGRPGLTPKWSFGFWSSSVYGSAEEVMNVAREYRERGFPADVIHVDPPWMGLGSLLCTLEWDPGFGDHREMLKVLEENNFRLCLYQTPYVPTDKPIFEEGVRGGYLVKDGDGKLLINAGPMNFWSPEFAYVDFTNPEACEWIAGKVKKLLAEGVSVMKLDLGELYPEEAVYHNGMDGVEGHNFLPDRYARCVYEATQEVQGEEAVVWRRSGGIGAARYPVCWAGDVRSSYPSMAAQLRTILNAGLGGYVFFSHDIGGFQGRSDERLYIRWFQLGMFTSHARAHGGAPHEPWNKGPKAAEICKKFAELRYSLMPHIFSGAIDCCRQGLPMLKPLYLVYPSDRNVRNIADEYIFTDEILVAPVLDESDARDIYLPEGTWIDFWDRRTFEGPGWIGYECPLDRMPLFVRKGSVLVATPPARFIDDKDWTKLALWIYPDRSGSKVFHMNPGRSCRIEYTFEDGRLDVDTDIPCDYEVVNMLET